MAAGSSEAAGWAALRIASTRQLIFVKDLSFASGEHAGDTAQAGLRAATGQSRGGSMAPVAIGDNSEHAVVRVEARLFNSLSKYAGTKSWRQSFTLPAGSTLADVVAGCGLPRSEIFLILLNGRDVSAGLVGDPVNLAPVLADGDVVAFSGPVPYSYGYGAAIV